MISVSFVVIFYLPSSGISQDIQKPLHFLSFSSIVYKEKIKKNH